ncbi:membrane protein [Streptomyces daghestanicus]|uniref:Uncharacterized protein n=2 Tax=Streptomyces TaxID=1883 RepID=A0ABT9LQD9_STRGD|nr:hypothetical protein [Streptomyces griseoviridis]GGS76956.1 membrane protein [Streptomyces griseoviridis]GGU14342.1 membrane protein [Streptomyces daghestanicus]GHI35038.1 membrane protein [Streptomyces daghestanicus]
MSAFGPVTRQLGLYRRAAPPVVRPFASVGPRLLGRLPAEVAARRRAARRGPRCATAAALVCAVAVPGAAVVAARGAETVRVAAADARSGVRARVTATDRPWGSGVELEVRDGAGPRSCRLVAVGRDGSEAAVAAWRSPQGGGPTTVRGGAAPRPSGTARCEVRTSGGERLVVLSAR